MTEEELEKERWIDDDCAVVSQYYSARRMYPTMTFYLQDEMEKHLYLDWT